MKVSVIISTYNNDQYLGEAIDSILGQDRLDNGDFECIVVDDGSTDDTPKLLANYRDPRLQTYRLPANCGIGIARNVGIRCAKGEYIAIMDGDDIAFPQRLSAQARFLDKNPGVHILGTRTVRVQDTPANIINKPPHPVEDAIIKSRLLLLNGTAMINPTSMVRRQFIDKHQLLYASISIDEDHEFWIQCVAAGARFHTLEDTLLYKRRHSSNITLTQAHTKEAGKLPLRIKLIGMYFPHLTTFEASNLALLFQKGISLTRDQATAGLEAGKKALTESRSYYGESRPQLREILQVYLSAVNNAIKSSQAAI